MSEPARTVANERAVGQDCSVCTVNATAISAIAILSSTTAARTVTTDRAVGQSDWVLAVNATTRAAIGAPLIALIAT